jgi:hypothetical protein
MMLCDHNYFQRRRKILCLCVLFVFVIGLLNILSPAVQGDGIQKIIPEKLIVSAQDDEELPFRKVSHVRHMQPSYVRSAQYTDAAICACAKCGTTSLFGFLYNLTFGHAWIDTGGSTRPSKILRVVSGKGCLVSILTTGRQCGYYTAIQRTVLPSFEIKKKDSYRLGNRR